MKGMLMETKFTPEQIARAKAAGSPEELVSLAKENGVELTEDQADAYFGQLNKSGEMSDDELGNVAGGSCNSLPPNHVGANDSCDKWVCERCGKSKNEVSRIHFHNTLPYYRHCESCKYASYENTIYLCNHPTGKG